MRCDVGEHSNGVVVRQSGEGPATWAMGSLFEHLVSAEATEGRLDVSLVTQPPGIATPLHKAHPGGLMSLYDEVGIPARERRLPGSDGQSAEVEFPKWAEVGPRYGLQVVGPGIPE